ncbi:MAG: hypothetical protein ACYSR1_06090 [Planctomycetota bacterium]
MEKNLDVDYMIVVDLDLYSFSIDGIANSFGQRIPWDVVASNGKHIRNIYKSLFGYHYYDAYALREIGDMHPLTEEIIFSYQDMLKPLKVGMPMIKVASAFNGLAIYKKEAIKGLRYFVKENDDKRVEVEVDHMPFHSEIIKKHDLFFINPSQTLYYNTYTNYIRQFPFKLMRKLFSILK